MGAEPVPAAALNGASAPIARLRDVHQEMVDAALSGGGIDRVAELAASQLARPVAVVVPEHGVSVLGVPQGMTVAIETLRALELNEQSRATHNGDGSPDLESAVDVALGGEVIGGVYMLRGKGAPAADAPEILHLVALTSVTILALEEKREREAARLGSGLIDDLRWREVERAEIVRRGARLGSNFEHGAVVIACEAGGRRPQETMALIAGEYPGAICSEIEERVYALLPALAGAKPDQTVDTAFELADRVRSYGRTGVSSYYADPSELRRAIQEAELVLEVTGSDERVARQLDGRAGSGVYRLLFRALASHPEEVKTFYEDTVAPLVRYDDQYHTDLLPTLECYLEQDCNMNATARRIYAHRHTVAYRLQRVRELTGLDPMISEERERLSLGLKAYRIVAPTLPR